MKLKKGDMIKIITGKEKGKTGKVIKVVLKDSKVLIEGLNLYKKHIRPKTKEEKGQTVLVPRPISASNVMLLCPGCNKTVRAGYRFHDTYKVRVCKKCGAVIQ